MLKPDEELLQQLRRSPEGDLRAFEQLVRQYQRRIVANCRHIIRDQNNAEDLAQEVFVKAYFGLAKFEGRSSFRHWLRRIKVNHCLNYVKKEQRHTVVSIEDPDTQGLQATDHSTAAGSHLKAITERELISKVLDSMSETLRLPLVLRDVDELPYEDIASALGISLSAVKMRIKRAREEFKERYRAYTQSSPQEETA